MRHLLMTDQEIPKVGKCLACTNGVELRLPQLRGKPTTLKLVIEKDLQQLAQILIQRTVIKSFNLQNLHLLPNNVVKDTDLAPVPELVLGRGLVQGQDRENQLPTEVEQTELVDHRHLKEVTQCQAI